MTQFFKDLQNLGQAFKDSIIQILCYFIGHKKADWNLSHDRLTLKRECPRCGEFEYKDSRMDGVSCGNERHPNGAWHEATPYPADHDIRGWTLHKIRTRRNGCGCKVKKEKN